MSPPDADAALRLRRLELDNEDLRAENARLTLSILQRQEEIVALGEATLRLRAEVAALRGRPRLRAALRRLMRRG